MISIHPWQRKLELFLEEKRSANRLLDSTVKSYRQSLEQVLDYIDRGDLDGIKKDLLFSQSSATHIWRICLYRDFFSGTEYESFFQGIKKPRGSLSSFEPRFLTDEELNNFLKVITQAEDQLFVMFALRCGLRISEIMSLRFRDVFQSNGAWWIRVIQKGNKKRALPLTAYMKDLIDRFGKKNGKIFLKHVNSYRKRLKKYAKLSGVEGIYAHALRHTFATRMLAKDVNIKVLQNFLGHESLITTSRYLHVTNKELLNAQEKLES